MNLQWRIAVRDSRHPHIDVTAAAVAFALDSYANRQGYCWPSRNTIAAGAKCDVRTVDRAVRRLEAAGFVEVSRSRGRTSNSYRLLIPNSGTPPPLNSDGESPLTAAESRRNGGADDTVTAAPMRSNRGADVPLTGSKPVYEPGSEPVDPQHNGFAEPANEPVNRPDIGETYFEHSEGRHLLKDMP
jgi:hypothetical protein